VKKQFHKPFFSIVIPTYNRSKYLACAIHGVLRQKYTDYELIISDNASSDDTQKIMSTFASKKIRYFRNRKNIGWIGNVQNAIDHAKGKYIFLHGDDDYIFETSCLLQLHKILSKVEAGLVRMNYITYADKTGDIFDVHNPRFVSKEMKKKSTDEAILTHIQNIDPFFITGLVFEGAFLKKNPLIQSEYVPWFPAMFDAIQKKGSVVFPEYHIITSWSQNDNPRYRMNHGEYPFEKYYQEVKKHSTGSQYDVFIHHQLYILISEFPAARYYLSLKGFWKYALHTLDIDKTFCKSPYFWFYFLGSVAVPKFELKVLKGLLFNKYKNAGILRKNVSSHIATFRKVKEDENKSV